MIHFKNDTWWRRCIFKSLFDLKLILGSETCSQVIFQCFFKTIIFNYFRQLAYLFVFLLVQRSFFNMLSIVKRFFHYFIGLNFHALAKIWVLMLRSSHSFGWFTALNCNWLLFILCSSHFNQRSSFMNVGWGSVISSWIGRSLISNNLQKAILILNQRWTIFSVIAFLEEIDWTTFRFRNRFLIKVLLTYCWLLYLGARRRWPVVLEITVL